MEYTESSFDLHDIYSHIVSVTYITKIENKYNDNGNLYEKHHYNTIRGYCKGFRWKRESIGITRHWVSKVYMLINGFEDHKHSIDMGYVVKIVNIPYD